MYCSYMIQFLLYTSGIRTPIVLLTAVKSNVLRIIFAHLVVFFVVIFSIKHA
jgi:hypothetical protein